VTYVRRDTPLTSTVLTLRADGGGGEPEVVLDSVAGLLSQTRWSPDGEWLLFTRSFLEAEIPRVDIVGLRSVAGDSLEPVVASPRFAEYGPALSPDGRWLAYASNETGAYEIHVRPFPDVESGRVRVSAGGGRNPRWSRDGSELFFLAVGRHMVAARVTVDPGFRVVALDTLFEFGMDPGIVPVAPGSVGYDAYDVAPDRRFLMPGPLNVIGNPVRNYILLQGFSEALRRASDRGGGPP
jgi:dipeptidyl aminopeptidase/acylaminoacyl peptidase